MFLFAEPWTRILAHCRAHGFLRWCSGLVPRFDAETAHRARVCVCVLQIDVWLVGIVLSPSSKSVACFCCLNVFCYVDAALTNMLSRTVDACVCMPYEKKNLDVFDVTEF